MAFVDPTHRYSSSWGDYWTQSRFMGTGQGPGYSDMAATGSPRYSQIHKFEFVGDFDGDGRADLTYFDSASGWTVLLYRDDGWEEQTWGKGDAAGYWQGYDDPGGDGNPGIGTRPDMHQFTGDFNGDGKTDLMYWSEGEDVGGDTVNVGWRVLLSTGSGWEDQYWGPGEGEGRFNDAVTNYYFDSVKRLQHHFTGDFNGDGSTDFMYRDNTIHRWRVLLSAGNGWDASVDEVWPDDGGGIYGWTVSQDWLQHHDPDVQATQELHFVGDFNGDGRTDLLIWPNSGALSSRWNVLLSQGTQWTIQAMPSSLLLSDLEVGYRSGSQGDDARHYNVKHFVGDFTGNGKTDFMYWSTESADDQRWTVLTNTDTGWVKQQRPTNGQLHNTYTYVDSTHNSPPSSGYADRDQHTGDFDGDGITDFMFHSRILHSTGNDWQVVDTGGPISTGNNGISNFYNHRKFIADFNGDGRDDLLYWQGLPAGWTLLAKDPNIGLENPGFQLIRNPDSYTLSWTSDYSTDDYYLYEADVWHDPLGNETDLDWKKVTQGGTSYIIEGKKTGAYRYKLKKMDLVYDEWGVIPVHAKQSSALTFTKLGAPNLKGPDTSFTGHFMLSAPVQLPGTTMVVQAPTSTTPIQPNRFNIVTREFEWDFYDQPNGDQLYRAVASYDECKPEFIDEAINDILFGASEECAFDALVANKTITVNKLTAELEVDGSTVSVNGVSELSYHVLEKQLTDGSWNTVSVGTSTSFSLVTGNTYRVKSCSSSGIGGEGHHCILSDEWEYLLSGAQIPEPPVSKPTHLSYGDDAIGSLAGNFRVNEAGAATYSIPIMAAAGTAGVVPEISLNYSSQAGNGIAGKGWSIGGGSSITRCRQTLQIDGSAKPITWSDQDRFCLDGQRLLVDDGQVYGAVGATYRTEIDSFSTVTSVNGTSGHPDYFRVVRKDGSISYYGKTVNARQVLNDGSNSFTNAWAINQLEDSFGNPIKFTYINNPVVPFDANPVTRDEPHQNNTIEGFALDRVYYAFGENVTANTSRTFIQFNYQAHSRPDSIYGYLGGFLLANELLLESVASYNEYEGSATLMRQYNLEYETQPEEPIVQANLISRLSAVEECEGQGACKPATTFDWGETIPFVSHNITRQVLGLRSGGIGMDDWGVGINQYVLLDINGDGVKDIAWLDVALDGTGANQYLKTALNSNGNFTLVGILNDVDGIGGGGADFFENNPSRDDEKLKLEVIDYNADGREDLLIFNGRGTDRWELFLSTPVSANSWAISKNYINMPFTHESMAFGDLNSDGLVDAYYLDADTGVLHLWYMQRNLSQPSTSRLAYHFVSQQPVPLSLPADTISLDYEGAKNASNGVDVTAIYEGVERVFHPILGDFNGDGQVDLSGVFQFKHRFTMAGTSQQSINFGVNVTQYNSYSLVAIKNSSGGYDVSAPFDFAQKDLVASLREGEKDHEYLASRWMRINDSNSDGLSDVMLNMNNSWVLYLGLGSSDFSSIPINIGSMDHESLSAVDINRDGYADIFWRQNASLYVRYWRPQLKNYGGVHTLSNSASTDDKVRYSYINVDGDPEPERIIYDGVNYRMSVDDYNFHPSPLARHENIYRIHNGLGSKTVLTYEPLSQTSNYLRVEGISNASVNFCYPNPLGTICLEGPSFAEGIGDFYQRLNDPFYDLPADSAQLHPEKSAPILEFMAPMQVVTRVESSAPAANDVVEDSVNYAAKSAIGYIYHQAKIQAAGRGYLGFKKITSLDEQTGVRTTTEYRQDFPFIGMPVKTEVFALEGDLISRSENEWGLMRYDIDEDFQDNAPSDSTITHPWILEFSSGTNGCSVLGALQPYLAHSTEKTYDNTSTTDAGDEDGLTFSGNVLQSVVTTNTLDKYGNIESSEVKTYSGDVSSVNLLKTQTVINSYAPTNGWSVEDVKRFGRLSHSAVTHDRGDNTFSAVTRSSAFTYYPLANGGQLETETIEPFDSTTDEPEDQQYELKTTYLYDAFGNKKRATQQAGDANNGAATVDVNGSTIGAAANNRYTRWEYDTLGRYVNKTYNSDEHLVEEVQTRNLYGAPTQVANIDGVVTETDYTPFGKPYLSYISTGSWTHTTYISCSFGCPTGAVYGIKTRQAGGSHSTEYFDLLGRSIEQRTLGFDGETITTQTEYDNIGRVVRQSTPYSSLSDRYWMHTRYDMLGRPVEILQPHTLMPVPQTISYNGFATTTSITSSNSSAVIGTSTETTVQITNALGELVSVTDALNGEVSYAYDEQGNLHKTTTSAGDNGVANGVVPTAITITLYYDKLGRKINMDDPDKGYWTYEYNGFGELIDQIDANGNVTLMSYDALGRQVRREDWRDADGDPATNDIQLEGNTVWVYDSARVGAGKLDYAEDLVSGYRQTNDYDAFGRLHQTTTVTGSAANDAIYSQSTTWDQYGRVFQRFDATGNDQGSYYRYNTNGYLASVSEANAVNGEYQRYFTVRAMTARGQVSEVEWGNGAVSYRHYDPARGTAKQLVTVLGLYNVQNLTVNFDDFGNLISRHNQGLGIGANSNSSTAAKNVLETFTYDALNRLRTVTEGGAIQQEMTYDSFGNIKTKSDVGIYAYGETTACGAVANHAGPHAVTSVVRSLAGGDGGSETYCYDRNGNMVADTSPDGNRTLVYSSFDKPIQVNKGNHQIDFAYGPDRARYKRIDTNTDTSTVEKTTLYMGNVERITHHDGTVEFKRYLEGQLLVTDTYASASATTYDTTIQYLIKDYLGSTELVLNHDPTQGLDTVYVAEDMSFDAWGQRRQSLDGRSLTTLQLLGFNTATTTRGYTGHEMLDEVGLVHMNGRIYDPRLGRFMQADPFIDGIASSQGYNRYSYGGNNPLNGTDPSGYGFLHDLLDPISYILVGVVSIGLCGPYAAVCAGVATTALSLGNGATWNDALLNGVSAAAFTYFGPKWAPAEGGLNGAYAVKMGVLGGITSVLSGGKFGHGFISAGIGATFGRGFGPGGNAPMAIAGRAVVAAVVGGTVSELTGGKFANGAATAAFASLVSSGAQAAKRLHGGTGGSASNVTEKDVLKRWEALRKTPEISAIEKRLGRPINVTASNSGVTGYLDGDIHVNLTDLTLQYDTVLPPDLEANFEHLQGDAYFDAINDFVDNYPKSFDFSIDRILTHEAFHAFDGAPTGLKYQLNRKFYEQPVIDRTNEFMHRNFNEPYRKDHDSVRPR